MRVYHDIEALPELNQTVFTQGTFDGVHVGHRKILEKVTQNTNDDSESLALTFFPHPRMVLQKDLDIKLINTIEESRLIFSEKNKKKGAVKRSKK